MYWTVYIIQSTKTGEIYIGYTNKLKRRLNQHNVGKSFSTKTKGPWVLIYAETYRSREDAKIREQRLKRHAKALGQLKGRIKNSILKDILIFDPRKVRG